MMRIDIRLGYALLALAVASPAAAEDAGFDWLGPVGDFVRNGLGPPRTLEDIRREEQRVLEAGKSPAPKVVLPAPAAPVPAAVPVPAPVPLAEPAVTEPVLAVPAPAPDGMPEAKKPEIKRVEVKPVEAKPVALPMPVPEARPKPVVARVPTPPPPPEPLTSRIAATATLDQAVRLGGSAEIYTPRLKKPVRN